MGEIDMCCGTLCDPQKVKDHINMLEQYISELEEKNRMLEETLGESLGTLKALGYAIVLDS